MPRKKVSNGLIVAVGLVGAGGALAILGVGWWLDRGCSTVECEASQAVQQWSTDPSGVAARVAAIPDDIERTYVVGKLAEAYPDQTSTLCSALPPGRAQERCVRISSRDHLAPRSLAQAADRAGTAARDGANPLQGATAARADAPLAPCTELADLPACLDEQAQLAARAGEVDRAEAFCSHHGDPVWADDCRFSAAEAATAALGASGYPLAAALCTRSLRFEQECLMHALGVPLAGALTWPPGEAASVVPAAASVGAVWDAARPDDRGVARRRVERFWSFFFMNRYRSTDEPDGTPFGDYPPETWPQLRGALALRMAETGRLTGTLAGQVSLLEAAAGRRTSGRIPTGAVPRYTQVKTFGWPLASETTNFGGVARRAYSPDVAVDVLYCVIEAAAQQEPADLALLTEATGNPDPTVAAEARRLLDARSQPSP